MNLNRERLCLARKEEIEDEEEVGRSMIADNIDVECLELRNLYFLTSNNLLLFFTFQRALFIYLIFMILFWILWRKN